MESSPFTTADKLAAIERELRYRRHIYPRWIKAGKITDGFASAQIAIFEAIAHDYSVALIREAAETEAGNDQSTIFDEPQGEDR